MSQNHPESRVCISPVFSDLDTVWCYCSPFVSWRCMLWNANEIGGDPYHRLFISHISSLIQPRWRILYDTTVVFYDYRCLLKFLRSGILCSFLRKISIFMTQEAEIIFFTERTLSSEIGTRSISKRIGREDRSIYIQLPILCLSSGNNTSLCDERCLDIADSIIDNDVSSFSAI